ncbi:MAG: elongation factor G [Planctomycetes bacterium]|nr:elongation factor G [Planctomycetota bacterium]
MGKDKGAKKNSKTEIIPDLSKIRNIGVIAHIDAGETTTTERILFYSGKERRIGDVDDGTTVTDWYEEEQERGITIFSTAVSLTWKEHNINIIDTPGHVDFTAEVERSLRVLDGAVVVICGVAGVQAQSETVWRQAKKYKVPSIAFINKLDRNGGDFDKALESMVSRLNATPVPVAIPYPREEMKDFKAVIDVIERKLVIFDEKTDGKELIIEDLPDEFHEAACEEALENLMSVLADADDEFAELYIEKASDEITKDEIWQALRRATLADLITPVFCGSSLKNKGVQLVMDGILKLLPSPLDRDDICGYNPKSNAKILRKPSISEAFSALAFKTFATKHYNLTYLRVYSGKARNGEMFSNPRVNKKERLAPIFRIHAMSKENITHTYAGDIIVCTNMPNTYTGDTLCSIGAPILLEQMQFPHTVVQMAIEPKSSVDRDKLNEVLGKIAREDPTFRVIESMDTGQLLIAGMGELHLEVILHRIANEFKIRANVGKPSVAYKETLAGKKRHSFEFSRVSPSGQELYAGVTIEIEHDSIVSGVQVNNECSKDIVPLQYHPVIEKSLKESLESCGNFGFPVIQVRAKFIEGKFEEGKTNEPAFQAAVAGAVREAVAILGTSILEPIMSIVVETPEDYIGNVQRDLNVRRALITQVDNNDGLTILKGEVPIASMFGYVASLRAQSQGRATYSMEPKTYAPVPEIIQKKFDY